MITILKNTGKRAFCLLLALAVAVLAPLTPTARAASDVILMTLPDCCAIIMRPKCFMHRNVPVRFVPMVAFPSSRLVS